MTNEDLIMHALELASEASKRPGKWATPPEVTAFGKTGEVGLAYTINTDDLNALVRDGRAESTVVRTGYIPEERITTRQLMYRPTEGKTKKARPKKSA